MNSHELIASRQATHGPAFQNHCNIAALWSAYLGVMLSPDQVAIMMMLLKAARTKSGHSQDHYDDMAGYAVIAGQCREALIALSQGQRPQDGSPAVAPSPSPDHTVAPTGQSPAPEAR